MQATLDLAKYKIGLYDSDYFDNKLKRLSEDPSAIFKISVSSQLNETVAIYVHEKNGVDVGSVGYTDSQFNKEISDRKKFKIKGNREGIEAWLDDAGWDKGSLCDNNECRVDLGQFLNVDKLILIELNVLNKEDLFTCEIVYTNPKDETSRMLEFFKTKMNGRSVVDIVTDSVGIWVDRFYDKLNPASLSFQLGPGVNSVDLYVDKKFLSRLPHDFDLDPQEKAYTLMFSAIGYENYTKRYNLGPNNRIESNIVVDRKQNNSDIRLIRKTRSKAFVRSMTYPGWGQIYSYDKRRSSNRKRIGRGLMIGGIITLVGAAYSWDNYNRSLDRYNYSKSIYLEQTTMAGIQEWNMQASKDNQIMKDNHSIALGISLLGVSYWIGNAIEAVINMPEY